MDKANELLARLGEVDNFTERKPKGAKRDELRRTIVAFANSVSEAQSGVLYIGVLNDGTSRVSMIRIRCKERFVTSVSEIAIRRLSSHRYHSASRERTY